MPDTSNQPAAVPTIETVLAIAKDCSNWNRWGPDDELGTLNHVGSAQVLHATSLVVDGVVVSLAIPFDENGPQHGGRRFNPIHLMTLDGSDAVAGFNPRTEPGGHHLQVADDILILPLQCGTQWDGLSHIMFNNQMYNGYSAAEVTSRGARRLDITGAANSMVGRGVLLDMPLVSGVGALEPGVAITAGDLDRAADALELEIRPGDFLLVRTGHMRRARDRGNWGDYAGGPSPGLGLAAARWIAEHDIAAVCTDTWGMEVLPNETPDVFQPLHIILIAHMGLWIGEIFDLEELAVQCAARKRYEFLFSAPPLPVTGAVGSPINPIAVL